MGVISTGPGSPLAFSSASGGKVYGYNNISNAAPITVAPANTQRQSIIFHNPGAQDIFISPANINNTLGSAPTTGAATAFTPTTALLGGAFRVFANGGSLTITGECSGAWRALAAAGATNSLTVMESNV